MDRSNTVQGNGQWTTPVNVSQKAGNPRLSASQGPRSMYGVWFFKRQLFFPTARVTCRHISDNDVADCGRQLLTRLCPFR